MSEAQLLTDLTTKAEAGDLEAQYELSWRSILGIGLPMNEAFGLECLIRAAKGGHPLAQNNLGARYLSGDGVPEDRLEAYKWFTLAALAGDRKAGKNRDTVAAQLSAEELAQAEARLREC